LLLESEASLVTDRWYAIVEELLDVVDFVRVCTVL
jgi:hypothetical protein